jgi:hypothetical protein
MLRYTKSINANISEDTPPEELARKIKYFVESEIAPALHDLDRDIRNPNRSWFRRLGDGVSISASVITGLPTGGLGQTAAEGIKNILVAEMEGTGSKYDAAKQNGLYYVLKASA